VRGGFDEHDSIGGHSVGSLQATSADDADKQNCGGSSSGCAIAVAAGLAPVALGSDTESSIVAPAVRAALYGLRPSTGLTSTAGTLGLSRMDAPGPMAKDVRDLADLLAAVAERRRDVEGDAEPGDEPGDEPAYEPGEPDWQSVRVGTLDPEAWQYADALVKRVPAATQQMVSARCSRSPHAHAAARRLPRGLRAHPAAGGRVSRGRPAPGRGL
jgi:amidase